MNAHITVGETGQPADPQCVRGTVTAILTQQTGGQPIISINAAIMGTSCSVRLTVVEVARLRDALDAIITQAGTSGPRRPVTVTDLE